MNCRRVSSLLSAYLDAELTGAEMLEIRAHLDRCPTCQAEHHSLRQTKHLLSSLALRAPRAEAEFEALLREQALQMTHPWSRWMPTWLSAWRMGAMTLPRPMAATAVLSLAGLLLATATLDTPPQPHSPVATSAALQPTLIRPAYVEEHLLSTPYVPSVDVTPIGSSGRVAPILSVFNRSYPLR